MDVGRERERDRSRGPSRSPAPSLRSRDGDRERYTGGRGGGGSTYDLMDDERGRGWDGYVPGYRHGYTDRRGKYYLSDEDEGGYGHGYTTRVPKQSTRLSGYPRDYSPSASDSASDSDSGLVYGDVDMPRRSHSRVPSSSTLDVPPGTTSHTRRRSRSSSRADQTIDPHVPGAHPSYATPNRYQYADPAQYAPGTTKLAAYTGVPASAAQPQSNWAPIPECEMPGYVPPSSAAPSQAQAQAVPGAFPGATSDGQYMNPNPYTQAFSRGYPAPTMNIHAPSTAPATHAVDEIKPAYANPPAFQYAQVDPSVKYGSKSTAIPYAYSATPQFTSRPPPPPQTSEPQYVEITPGRKGGRPASLSVSSANNLSVGGPDSRPPASPLLEPYKGTYQSISPMPSPIMSGARMDDDVSDIEPLDGAGTGSDTSRRRKKSKRKSRDEKEKEKSDRSKRDRSSTRHERQGSRGPGPESMVLISPSSSKKKVTFYDPVPDAIAMRDALSHTRHFDTKALIQILPHIPSEDILALRKEYKNHVKIHGKGINMAKHIKSKLGNSAFGKVCYATALGRWESEAYWANCYYQSSTSRRELLIESLIGRSNAEIAYIKDSFRDSRYADSLERCMKSELKADKFRMAVLLALEERRQSERAPLDIELVKDDVEDLHDALVSKDGGETAMIHIIILRSDNHLREVLRAYDKVYKKNFARAMIAKSQNLVVCFLSYFLLGQD